MTKKPSEKNKTWEKDRRDRLNKSFDKLLKLLPNYDPSITWSKIEIIQKSIDHIEDLHKKHEDYLKCKDPLIFNEYETLLESLRYYRVRNSQLADLLKKANIKLPAFDLPKLLKENSKFLDQNHDIFRLNKESSLTQENNENTEKPAKKIGKKNVTTKNRQSKITNEDVGGNEKLLNTQLTVNNNLNEYLTHQKYLNAINTTENNGLNSSTGVLIPVNIIPLQQSVSNASILHPPLNQAVPSEIPSLIKLNNVPRPLKCYKSGIRCRTGKQKILPQPFIKLYYRRSDGKIPIPLLKRRVIVKPKFKRKRKSKNISLFSKKIDSNEIKANNNKSKTSDEIKRPVSPTAAFLMAFPVVSTSNGKHVHAENLENFDNFFSTKEYTNYCDQNEKEITVINEKTSSIQMETYNSICTSYLHMPTITSISTDAKTSFYHLPKTISTQGLAPICTPLPLDTKISSLLTSQFSLDTKKQFENSERIPLPSLNYSSVKLNQSNLINDHNLKYEKSFTNVLTIPNNATDFDCNWIPKPINTSSVEQSTINKNCNTNKIVMLTNQYKKPNTIVSEAKIVDSINNNSNEHFKSEINKTNRSNSNSCEIQTSRNTSNVYTKTSTNTQMSNTIACPVFGITTSTITTSCYQNSLPSLSNSWSSSTYPVASDVKSVNFTSTSCNLFQENLSGNDRQLSKPSTTKANKTNKKNSFKLDFLTNTSIVPSLKSNYTTTTSQSRYTSGHLPFEAGLNSGTVNLPTFNHQETNYLDSINKKELISFPSNVEFPKNDEESNAYSDLFATGTKVSKALSTTSKPSKTLTDSVSYLDATNSSGAVGPLLNTLGTQNNNFYYPLQTSQTATTFSFNLTTQTNTKSKKTHSKPIMSYSSIKSDVPWIQPTIPTPSVPITTAEYKSSFTFSLTPSTNIVSTSNTCPITETKVSKSISNSRISTTSESYPTTSFTFSLTTPRPLDPIFVGSTNRSDMYPSTQLQGKLWEEQPTVTNFTFALTKPTPSKNISQNANTDTKSKLFSTQFYDCEQLKNCKTSQKVNGHVNWMTSSTPAETHADFNNSAIGSSTFSHYPNTNREFCFSKKDSHLSHTNDENQFLTWSPNKTNNIQSSNINSGCYGTNNNNNSVVGSGGGGGGGVEYNYNNVQQSKENRNNSNANFFSVSQLVEHSSTIGSSDLNEFNIEASSNKFKPLSKSKDHGQKKDQYLKQAISNNYSAEALISKKEKHRNLATMHSNENYYNHNNNAYNSNFQSTDQCYNSGNYLYNYPATNQNYMTATDSTDYLDSSVTSTYTNNDIPPYGKEKKSLFPPMPTANATQSYDSTMNLFPVPLIPSGATSTNPVEHYDPSGLHHYVTPQYSVNYQSTSNWATPKSTNLSTNTSTLAGYQTNQTGLSYGSTIETNSGNQNVSANLPNFNLSSICPEINDKVDTHVW